jgi:excisionase family DNA binding protein
MTKDFNFNKIVGSYDLNTNIEIDDKLENKPLSIEDIANILRVSRTSVDRWLKNGKIRYYKIGNVRKVWVKDLIKFLEDSGNDSQAMKGLISEIKNRVYNLEIQQYLRESKDQEERIKRYAEIQNYLEGTVNEPIPWKKKDKKE